MVHNYYSLLKQIRSMRSNYPNLSIEDKLKLLQLEIKLESKSLKASDAHTKSEKKKDKEKINEVRKHNEKNKKESK